MGRTPVISAKRRVSSESVGMPPAHPLIPFLPDCARDRKACLHPFQLIPPRQPAVGIDGNLQQIVHLPSPEISVGEELQPRVPVAVSSGRRTTATSLDLTPESSWRSNSIKSSTQGLSCVPCLVVLILPPKVGWSKLHGANGRRNLLGSLRKFVAEHG